MSLVTLPKAEEPICDLHFISSYSYRTPRLHGPGDVCLCVMPRCVSVCISVYACAACISVCLLQVCICVYVCAHVCFSVYCLCECYVCLYVSVCIWVCMFVSTFMGLCVCIVCVCISVHLFIVCVCPYGVCVLRMCLHVSMYPCVCCVCLLVHACVWHVCLCTCVCLHVCGLCKAGVQESILMERLYPGGQHISPDVRMLPRVTKFLLHRTREPSAFTVFRNHSKNFSCK